MLSSLGCRAIWAFLCRSIHNRWSLSGWLQPKTTNTWLFLSVWCYMCREILGTSVTGFELPCIFPFYYQGKRFDNCTLLQRSSFVEPVWRCPVFNITTKYQDTGINSYEEDPREPQRYCLDRAICLAPDDCEVVLDPKAECPDVAKIPAFSTCKTDCPGGDW